MKPSERQPAGGDISAFLSQPVHAMKAYLIALQRPIPEDILRALSADPRKGARQFAEQIRKRSLEHILEEERLQKLLRHENELNRQGYGLIAGVDEAGMAPLAGPVVAAAVILPQNYTLYGLNDSKKINGMRKREMLARQIKEDSICWSSGRAEVEEIDRLNIYRAGLLAMARALKGLGTRPDFVLVDARTIPHCPIPQKAIVHGDALSASIAAASLIAKTTRDLYMIEMDRVYDGYGFASHKGYPTPKHLEALKQRGLTPIHRRSFAPVRDILQIDPVQQSLFPDFMKMPGTA